MTPDPLHTDGSGDRVCSACHEAYNAWRGHFCVHELQPQPWHSRFWPSPRPTFWARVRSFGFGVFAVALVVALAFVAVAFVQAYQETFGGAAK
jgi:hypothetical protein